MINENIADFINPLDEVVVEEIYDYVAANVRSKKADKLAKIVIASIAKTVKDVEDA